jgi:streptogramin lyase/cytochrome c551/c552
MLAVALGMAGLRGSLPAAAAIALLLAASARAEPALQGSVVDLGGRPLAGAMLTWEKPPAAAGPTAVTVFTDAGGHFRFPPSVSGGRPAVRLLGYRAIDDQPAASAGGAEMIIVMRADANQSGVAPASAWLASAADQAAREHTVMNCVGCHQLPAPEVRAYAASIQDQPQSDAASVEQSWRSIVHYMNYLSAWEFGRGGGVLPDAARVYSGGQPGPTAAALTRTLGGSFHELRGYRYGAPLLVDGRTVIREYAVPAPNNVREAVTLSDPGVLWAADVGSRRIIRIDARNGESRAYEVPAAGAMAPHTLVPGHDGTLWVTSLFPGTLARLDPARGTWRTWTLRAPAGNLIGVHDLSFDTRHELLTDRRGRIWYSDIVDNAVGWLDPRTGRTGIHVVPAVEGRTGFEQLYGLAMTSDRRHVWYSQLTIGCFGSFNIDAGRFETRVCLPDANAGPRRIALSDDDILYVPLYGSGQLIEYDTRTRRTLGTYDLPDRASAPYSAVWDPKRKVVWLATANADALYRFDPRDKSFAVLPLPREGAFLRMLQIDRTTGELVTSYANIVADVQGPRMALTIDLGDLPGPTGPVRSSATGATPLGPLIAPAAVAAAADGPTAVPALLLRYRCVACHDASATLVGPPFAAIAARHGADRPLATEVLARKIVLGGGGAWGAVPMPPTQQLSVEDARAIASWILAGEPHD